MEFFNNAMQIVLDSNDAVSGDMSVDLRSNVYDVRTYEGFSIQAKYTGSPVGTLKIQVSNDDPLDTVTQSFVDLANSDVAVSAAGTYVYNVEIAYYGWVRLFWDVTSGTGDLSAKIVLKGA